VEAAVGSQEATTVGKEAMARGAAARELLEMPVMELSVEMRQVEQMVGTRPTGCRRP